jgi:cytochrome b561
MSESYPALLRALHWLMAAIIFTAISLGVWAINLSRGTPLRVELLDLHKSLGVTALALVVLRVIVRLASKTPPYRPPLGRLNHVAAGAVHGLLYVAMIAMPLSGYVHSMAGKHEFKWFGLFQVPNIVPPSPQADDGAGRAHYILAIVIGALLTAHVLAALWHGFVRRDGVLARMWPSAARALTQPCVSPARGSRSPSGSAALPPA